MSEKVLPFYQVVDGIRIPGFFSPEVFRSGLRYQATPDDFFVSGHPKSGTTWAQQIVTLIFNQGKPPRNFMELNICSPFLDFTGAEGVAGMKRPGSIKTHVSFDRVPYSPQAKYLHIVRNPKDVVVSFFHHTHCDVYKFAEGNFDDYFDLFIEGKTDFGDFFDVLLSWYEHRKDPNVLYISYEQLKRETEKTVKEIASFMGPQYEKLLEDEEVLRDVLKYSSVSYMKSVMNKKLTSLDVSSDQDQIPEGVKHYMKYEAELKGNKPFELIRKGLVGNWNTIFTEDQNKRMDTKMAEKLEGTEIYSYWKSIGCI